MPASTLKPPPPALPAPGAIDGRVSANAGDLGRMRTLRSRGLLDPQRSTPTSPTDEREGPRATPPRGSVRTRCSYAGARSADPLDGITAPILLGHDRGDRLAPFEKAARFATAEPAAVRHSLLMERCHSMRRCLQTRSRRRRRDRSRSTSAGHGSRSGRCRPTPQKLCRRSCGDRVSNPRPELTSTLTRSRRGFPSPSRPWSTIRSPAARSFAPVQAAT